MIDPRIAHQIDARALLMLLPHMDQDHLHTVRQEFAAHLATGLRRRDEATTWQEAWNAWTGADGARAGMIQFVPTRCPDCRGRRVSTRNVGRNLARTGHPAICGECQGSGRGRTRIRQVALRARNPEQRPSGQ